MYTAASNGVPPVGCGSVDALRFASATRLIVGCADRSVRILAYDAVHRTLTQQHIFFTTAPGHGP